MDQLNLNRVGIPRFAFILLGALLTLSMCGVAPAQQVTTLFTTKEDFTGWTDNAGGKSMTMEPTASDLDKAADNGLGNVNDAGKAGTAGALSVTWRSGNFNGIKSPGEQANHALIEALGDGSGRQILVDCTEPPKGTGTYFSLLLNLNYNGHWTTIKPASVTDHGAYKTAAYNYTFNSAGLTYLSVGFIYASNYNTSTPFTIDNVRLVTHKVAKSVAAVPGKITTTSLFSTQADFTGWADTKKGASMQAAPSDKSLDEATVNGLGNVQSAGSKGASGSLSVTWKSGNYNVVQSPGQERNSALIDALGSGANKQILVDYTEPPKGAGTYFGLLLNLNYNNHWTQIKPASVTDHGTYKTAAYDYTFSPVGLTYLSIGFIYSSNYTPDTPFTIDNVRLVTVTPAASNADESAAPAAPVQQDMLAPRGVSAPWSLRDAWTRQTPTRSETSLNGLWRFYPAYDLNAMGMPKANSGWGWFKVPGAWPPANPAQQILLPPEMDAYLQQMGWKFSDMEAAWYKRTFTVPQAQAGRRFLIDFGLVQTSATVYVDGQRVGGIEWPGGMIDLTKAIKPGKTQELAILVTAYKAKTAATAWYGLGNNAKRDTKIHYRGLCGDVTLISEPMESALGGTHVITSVRKHRITFDTAVAHMPASPFRMSATVYRQGKPVLTINSDVLTTKDIVNGRVKFSGEWANPLLWDLDTPQNMYTAVVKLEDAGGHKLLDESTPISFGFREFWIDGRDFYLNGSKVHLRMAVNDTLSRSASDQSLAGALLSCRRAREEGVNAFITTPYGFLPGEVGYADNLYRATDQTGTLISVSLLNIMSYDWKLDDPKVRKEYDRVTEYLIHSVWNHPSVFAYAMNHNGLVYYDAANPLKLDGIYTPDGNPQQPAWQAKARKLAVDVAAADARKIDPTRPIYHHAAGNLGDMVTLNLYPNWAPIQERSDWFSHWATRGVKPLMLVEYGLPHVANWSSYRGPEFIWTSQARMWLLDREYAATFTGNNAYRMDADEVKSMELQLKMLKTRDKFFFWDINSYLVRQEHNFLQIKALFYGINLPAFRTWGLSGVLPWDDEENWIQIKTGSPAPWPDRYANLKQPGIVPDVRMPAKVHLHAWEEDHFAPSAMVPVLRRYNQPLLGYIAGEADHFTERGHNFRPGETIHKQLAAINDSRKEVVCDWSWSFQGGNAGAKGSVSIKPGEKAFVPVDVQLPREIAPGSYTLSAKFSFGGGVTQEDSFRIDVVAPRPAVEAGARIALLDPNGASAKLLSTLGISARRYESIESLPSAEELGKEYNLLIVGREALDGVHGLATIQAVKKGLNVLVLEQSQQTLDRLGFRTQRIGYRQVFERDPSHPALGGFSNELLHDWRGDSTLIQPYLDRPELAKDQPTVSWCGFEDQRVWRAGNRGTITSVVIEKPPVGNFLPLLDCGFDLQYTPLLEYTGGPGRILFCQLDVTGRSQADPAAENLLCQLIQSLLKPGAAPPARVFYAGDSTGAALLTHLGVQRNAYEGAPLGGGDLLVVGPGAEKLTDMKAQITVGANLLALGVTQKQMDKLLPGLLKLQEMTATPEPLHAGDAPALTGISNAEVFWRTFPKLDAIISPSGAGNQVVRTWRIGKGTVVVCQVLPRMFEAKDQPYLRTTYRRTVYLISRLLNNLGARLDSPLLERIATPRPDNKTPWLDSYYLQPPISQDDPYRFFPW